MPSDIVPGDPMTTHEATEPRRRGRRPEGRRTSIAADPGAAVAAALALLSAGGPAAAARLDAPPPACSGPDSPTVKDLRGWTEPRPLTAAAVGAGLEAAEITPGVAVKAALRAERDVAYPLAPQKAGTGVSYGGLLRVTAPSAGLYRIALSNPSWIELVRGGTRVASSAHARGPACSGVRKIVSFPLEPGQYLIELSASADPDVEIAVLPPA